MLEKYIEEVNKMLERERKSFTRAWYCFLVACGVGHIFVAQAFFSAFHDRSGWAGPLLILWMLLGLQTVRLILNKP